MNEDSARQSPEVVTAAVNRILALPQPTMDDWNEMALKTAMRLGYLREGGTLTEKGWRVLIDAAEAERRAYELHQEMHR